MGLGGTAKKIQKLASVAEEQYQRVTELREEVAALRTTVEDTGDRVESIERDLSDQRAILDAIATEHDVDVEGLLEEEDAEEASRASTTVEGGDRPEDREAP